MQKHQAGHNDEIHHGVIATPMYSNGTDEMDGKRVVGAVEGQTEIPKMTFDNATIHTFGKK
jgi:hypothetical protein